MINNERPAGQRAGGGRYDGGLIRGGFAGGFQYGLGGMGVRALIET